MKKERLERNLAKLMHDLAEINQEIIVPEILIWGGVPALQQELFEKQKSFLRASTTNLFCFSN